MDLDYYKILGVPKNASEEDIKTAYKKLAKKYHPDKNEGEELSQEIFKKVKTAYETLSDSHSRSRYDLKQSTPSRPQSPPPPRPSYKKTVSKEDYQSNLKYSIISVVIVAVIAGVALFFYPMLNEWASNDKMRQARSSAVEEDWTMALVHSTAAIEQWDENGSAYLLRARIRSAIYEKYRPALADFNRAFNLLPEDSLKGEHYYMRAVCHYETGNTSSACNDLKSAAEKGFDRAQQDLEVLCK